MFSMCLRAQAKLCCTVQSYIHRRCSNTGEREGREEEEEGGRGGGREEQEEGRKRRRRQGGRRRREGGTRGGKEEEGEAGREEEGLPVGSHQGGWQPLSSCHSPPSAAAHCGTHLHGCASPRMREGQWKDVRWRETRG